MNNFELKQSSKLIRAEISPTVSKITASQLKLPVEKTHLSPFAQRNGNGADEAVSHVSQSISGQKVLSTCSPL